MILLTINIVIVENTLLVLHDHVLVNVGDVNNTNLVGRHTRRWEQVARRESISLDNDDLGTRARDGRHIGNVACERLDLSESTQILDTYLRSTQMGRNPKIR